SRSAAGQHAARSFHDMAASYVSATSLPTDRVSARIVPLAGPRGLRSTSRVRQHTADPRKSLQGFGGEDPLLASPSARLARSDRSASRPYREMLLQKVSWSMRSRLMIPSGGQLAESAGDENAHGPRTGKLPPA